jgi:hypothetical protein
LPGFFALAQLVPRPHAGRRSLEAALGHLREEESTTPATVYRSVAQRQSIRL